ncbi:MAG: C40 family peptidase [Undibacterium sp.]|nr:C40 family peptidase [Undibacterium sp.]
MHIKGTSHKLKSLLILSLCVLTFASTSNAASSDDTPAEQSKTLSTLKGLRDRTSDLTINAMNLLGIKYKRGGNSPENGLDCSGFVRLVFKNANATELPRTAKEISQEGDKVKAQDLQPGDLVFYNTLKKSFSHVGIYLGDNKFIHSPSAGGKVRVESMNIAYWKKRFNGARRISEDPADK